MTDLSVGLMLSYLALAFGVRVIVQLRRFGNSGMSSISRAPRAELAAGLVFGIGIVIGAANPFLVSAGSIELLDLLDADSSRITGAVLCVAGIIGTFIAQLAMGASWRIGVDPEERTELITTGVFGWCRNPIYTAMLVAWAGFALLAPTWLSIAAFFVLLAGLEGQVRRVEEPHLIKVHGQPYVGWAARVGRFVPRLGRLRRPR